MKILLAAIIALSGFSGTKWLTNFDEAKTEATQSHKSILINFSGSDWCIPCIRMHKEIFESDAFTKYSPDNLVLVNADFPRLKKNQLSNEQVKQNEALADQYNPKGRFPFTVLVDGNGKVLKQWDGMPNESAEKFVSEIETITHAGH
jgi:thioredoxin-related protein